MANVFAALACANAALACGLANVSVVPDDRVFAKLYAFCARVVPELACVYAAAATVFARSANVYAELAVLNAPLA